MTDSTSVVPNSDHALAVELKQLSSIVRPPELGRPYLPDAGLVKAVKVSLILGRPLLVTGEPGTGKTQLAFWLGACLGYEVRKFEAKSVSIARDLFYSYDILGRLNATQFFKDKVATEINARDYISYNALGLAILRSHNYEEVKDNLPNGSTPWVKGVRSVVLIDEIDKAPRDFPNDLLNELEENYFKVPELGLIKGIAAAAEMRPIIIITSNSEKGLPDAFLRRCVYYNIRFPDDRERLADIVLAHNRRYDARRPWLKEAIDFFISLRSLQPRLEKRPSTAELLDWLAFLNQHADNYSLRERDDLLRDAATILFKTLTDRERADEIVNCWLEDEGGRP